MTLAFRRFSPLLFLLSVPFALAGPGGGGIRGGTDDCFAKILRGNASGASDLERVIRYECGLTVDQADCMLANFKYEFISLNHETLRYVYDACVPFYREGE